MTDNLGFGKAKRRDGNLDILYGRATFRFVGISWYLMVGMMLVVDNG